MLPTHFMIALCLWSGRGRLWSPFDPLKQPECAGRRWVLHTLIHPGMAVLLL